MYTWVSTVENECTLYQAASGTARLYYLPMTLVLYNTIDSDVGLAYLTTATVTIAVGDMNMSLVTFTKI